MNSQKRDAVGTLVATLMVAASLALAGCSAKETCAAGAETCPCTHGGACDPGLLCLSNRCVNPNPTDGGTGGAKVLDAATGSGGAPGSGGATGSGGVTGSGGAIGPTPDAGVDVRGTGGTAAGGTGGTGTTDAGTTPDVPTTPPAQCVALIKNICSRLAGPCSTPGAPATDELTCEGQNEVVLGCERATLSYATCLSDTAAISCASLIGTGSIALPASCTAPINATPLSDAQEQCYAPGDAFCQRSATCSGVIPTAAQLAACLKDFNDSILPCDVAVSVGPTYAGCLTGIMNLSCAAAPDAGAPDAGTPDGGEGVPACDTAIKFYGQP